MSGIGDGGPAFPQGLQPAGYVNQGMPFEEGISIRDYFAAKAMAAIIAHPGMEPDDSHREGVSQLAYEFADAMLKVRSWE
jgi:hypothetical protein